MRMMGAQVVTQFMHDHFNGPGISWMVVVGIENRADCRSIVERLDPQGLLSNRGNSATSERVDRKCA